jgi:hypothetical protein
MARKISRLAAAAAGLTVVLGIAVPVVTAPAALASLSDPCPAIAAAGDTTCSLEVSTATTSGPSEYTYGPAQIADAYGLNSGGVTDYPGLEGELQTVAVIGVGDDPTAADDLANYRAEYGLPSCTEADGCLKILNEEGQASPLPAEDPGYAYATSTALEMISAACPNCRLLVVEANVDASGSGDEMADIGTSVDEAVTQGATIVNEPITGDEVADEATAYDPDFDHPGVEITVPSGNLETGQDGFAYSGGTAAIQYPAASPYVTAVGGTNLDQAGSTSACTTSEAGSRGWCEEAWLPTISGCSQYEPKPVWQDGITACSGRADSDVAAVASSTQLPGNPMAITYGCTVASGCTDWMTAGGTSVASAIVAGIYADAGPPASATSCDPTPPTSSAAGCPAAYPYDNPGGSYTTPGNAYPYFAGLNGITTDDLNGTSVSSECTGTVTSLCEAGPGWNGITGVGTPQGVTSFAASGTESGLVDQYGGFAADCLTNDGGKVANGTEIEGDWCSDAANQQNWSMEDNGQIELGTTGYCIGVSGAKTAAGSDAVLWSCSGDPANQQWRVTGSGQLLEDNSGLCLDNAGTGSQITIQSCTDYVDYYVMPYDLPAATGEITNQAYSGQCLDNAGGKLADYNPIEVSACTGSTDAQEWTLEPGDGNIQIEGSDYCLGLDPSLSVGELEKCFSSSIADDAEQWIVESNGQLYLNADANGNCLYVQSDNGTQTSVQECNGGESGLFWDVP